MTDAREKQPGERILDLTRTQSVNTTYVAMIETWPYHSIKNEDVFTRRLTVVFRAMDFPAATGFALSLAETIGIMHDVWQCNVRCVMEQGAYPLQIKDEGPVAKSPDPVMADGYSKRGELADDVKRLIIAARKVAFGEVRDIVRSCHAGSGEMEGEAVDDIAELDKASEAFASRIDWEDQPEEDQ